MRLTKSPELNILNLEKNSENFQNWSLLFRSSEATHYRCGVVRGEGSSYSLVQIIVYRNKQTLWTKFMSKSSVVENELKLNRHDTPPPPDLETEPRF